MLKNHSFGSVLMLLAPVITSIFSACVVAIASVSTNSEGDIDFLYQGTQYKTHYKLFGDLHSPHTPVVVLHGGPGLSYDYMSPFSNLTSEYGIPVILYDQIGNGRSTHNPTAPAAFWTIELFINELSNLINHFDIQDSFSLVGHSWGTILGSEFVVQTKPQGLKRLVLTNGLASNELWGQSSIELLQDFPPDVQEGITNGMNNPVAFKSALLKFQAVHGVRVAPPPVDYLATIDWLFDPPGDSTVASMSDLITGNWTIIDRIPQIETKTLVINGKYDVSQDFVIAPFVEKLPHRQWVKFNNSSHMPFWEEPAEYLRTVGDFLTSKDDFVAIVGPTHFDISI